MPGKRRRQPKKPADSLLKVRGQVELNIPKPSLSFMGQFWRAILRWLGII
jgi:hypothetical protein